MAGTLKGKILKYPKSGIRPSSELIRAAIFNIIGDQTVNSNVADFFCGAGGLGIEALSRGAEIVYFFEKSNQVIKFLKNNLKGLKGVKVIRGDVLRKINTLKNIKFDIIIADPPYLKSLINSFIERVISRQIITRDGIIILQHHKKEEINIPAEYYLDKQKKYGDTLLSIIRRKE